MNKHQPCRVNFGSYVASALCGLEHRRYEKTNEDVSVPNLRAVRQFGGWVGKCCEQTDEATNMDSLNRGSFRAQQLRSSSDMEPSVEALRRRRIRVQNEISLTKKREDDRAEDLGTA